MTTLCPTCGRCPTCGQALPVPNTITIIPTTYPYLPTDGSGVVPLTVGEGVAPLTVGGDDFVMPMTVAEALKL